MEGRGRPKVAKTSLNNSDIIIIMMILSNITTIINVIQSKLSVFSITFLHYLVELDEYEDAAEITESPGDVAGEVSRVKNIEIPDNKSDVTTPTNPEQLRLEVN